MSVPLGRCYLLHDHTLNLSFLKPLIMPGEKFYRKSSLNSIIMMFFFFVTFAIYILFYMNSSQPFCFVLLLFFFFPLVFPLSCLEAHHLLWWCRDREAPHAHASSMLREHIPFGGKTDSVFPAGFSFATLFAPPLPRLIFHIILCLPKSPSHLPYALSFCWANSSFNLLGREVSKLWSSDSFGDKLEAFFPIKF